MTDNEPRRNGKFFRVRLGLLIAVFGFIVFVVGVNPGIFGADRSPVVGFVQIAVFLVGLAFVCLGGFVSLNSLWNGAEKTIAADVGYRLVATGYVISVASGMADILGFGRQPLPNIPYFGPFQAIGVMIGILVIIAGFILMTPKRAGTGGG
jgi:hypothetical protein